MLMLNVKDGFDNGVFVYIIVFLYIVVTIRSCILQSCECTRSCITLSLAYLACITTSRAHSYHL